MSFDLSIPDPVETKAQVEQELAVTEAHAEAIGGVANERGDQIMKVDLDSIADRRDILTAVEMLGSDIMKQSSAKNAMLSRRMAQLSREGGESGEVARGLEDLAIRMKDLDPSGVGLGRWGVLGEVFGRVRRYFGRVKTAGDGRACIFASLEHGKSVL